MSENSGKEASEPHEDADVDHTHFEEFSEKEIAQSGAQNRRKWITIGCVAAVIVVCACGFGVWHNTPGFCDSVCHSPMDNYVASYYSGDEGFLVTAHADEGLSCLDCHEARIGQQIQEVGMWIDDSYIIDSDGNLVIEANQYMASKDFCLKSGCHDYDEVVSNTWGFADNDEKYNPHSSHQDGSIVCGDCHKSHVTSTLYCSKCHSLNLPEGWESAHE